MAMTVLRIYDRISVIMHKRVELKTVGMIIFLSISARIIPAFLIFGTEDVSSWYFAKSILEQGQNPYSQNYLFNWPPFILYPMSRLVDLSFALNIPYHGLIKIPAIICDAAIAVMIYKIFLNMGFGGKKAALSSLLYALNPVSIIITAVHGNYVSLTLFFLFAAAYLLYFNRGTSGTVYSALAFGVAIASKTWPLLFLPLFLQNIKSRGKKALFLLLCVSAVLILLLPLYLADKKVFANAFLNYRGIIGWWGFTGIFQIWPSEFSYFFLAFYRNYGIFILGAALLSLYLFKTREMDMFDGFVPAILVSLFFMAGFGPQYLAWILPFLIVARNKMFYPFTVLAFALFIMEYALKSYDGSLYTYMSGMPLTVLDRGQFLFEKKWTTAIRMPFWIFIGTWMACALKRR